MINLETSDWGSLVNMCLELISTKRDNRNDIVYDIKINDKRMKKYGLRKTKAGSISYTSLVE